MAIRKETLNHLALHPRLLFGSGTNSTGFILKPPLCVYRQSIKPFPKLEEKYMYNIFYKYNILYCVQRILLQIYAIFKRGSCLLWRHLEALNEQCMSEIICSLYNILVTYQNKSSRKSTEL